MPNDVTRKRRMGTAVSVVLGCFLVVGLFALASCGGGGAPDIGGVTVEASLHIRTVAPGSALTFTATVSGATDESVNWIVQEANGGTITDAGEYTAPDRPGTYHVVAVSVEDPTASDTCTVTVSSGPPGSLVNLFFLHHSVGDGLVVQGDMRGAIHAYNSARGTSFVLWDHGYNADGLRDPWGNFTAENYDIPDDNTDVEGLFNLWTGSEDRFVTARNLILDNHEVIAFKSCFPNSDIPDAATLAQYQTWYLGMRDFFDTRTDRLFVVMSTPPLHRLATSPENAARARSFANWLGSGTYLSGHSNIVCFDLFDYLARADDGSATANMLKYAYEGSHSDGDSHPSALGYETVGPIFAEFLCNAAGAYTP